MTTDTRLNYLKQTRDNNGKFISNNNKAVATLPPTATAQSYNSHVLSKVNDIIIEQLGVDWNKITPETSFQKDLQIDSLDVVELTMAFEEEFDIEIPDEHAEGIITVGEAVKYIEDHADLSANPQTTVLGNSATLYNPNVVVRNPINAETLVSWVHKAISGYINFGAPFTIYDLTKYIRSACPNSEISHDTVKEIFKSLSDDDVSAFTITKNGNHATGAVLYTGRERFFGVLAPSTLS